MIKMIKQDFLLAQIEELTKKIARLLRKKETNEPDIDTAADDCYKAFRLNLNSIINLPEDELTELVPDWQLLELLVKIMLNDTRINHDLHQMEKAQALLYYVQENDRTYSFDRIAMAKELDTLIQNLKSGNHN